MHRVGQLSVPHRRARKMQGGEKVQYERPCPIDNSRVRILIYSSLQEENAVEQGMGISISCNVKRR